MTTSDAIKRPRILLVGLGTTTQTALEALAERFEVCGLIRPGDDPTVKQAREAGIPLFQTTTLAGVAHAVDAQDPDAVVVSSYDRILPAALVVARPFVNVHYAPLPRYRGRATVNWAILNGEPSMAISVHCLEPDLDAGGILAQETVALGPRSTAGSVYAELNATQRRILADAVERRLRGDRGRAQDESRATYSCTRVPDDGEVRWTDSTARIDRLVRALHGPFPPAFTFLGPTRIDVHEAHPVTDAPAYDGRIPGRVVRVDRSSGAVDVLTGDGVLRLLTLSTGTELVRAADLITSVRLTLCSRLESRVADLEQRLAALASAGNPGGKSRKETT